MKNRKMADRLALIGKAFTRLTHKFENFIADMGRRPVGRYSLERKNNNGNYEPSNCKWATFKEQERNRRDSLKVEWDGAIMPLKEVCEKVQKPYQLVWRRIRRFGWPLAKALSYVFVLLLVGCRGSVRPAGKIGPYTIYSVKLPSAAGPSINIALLQSEDTNSIPQVIGIASGNGVSTTVLQAGGIMGAATLLRPAQVNNTSSTVEVVPETPDLIGPPAPPTTIGNDKNDRPFTHRK